MLRDGFVVMETSSDRHALDLDRDGNRRSRNAVPVTVEARVVGSSVGALVGWLDGRQLKLAKIVGDGKLGNATSWGRSVRRLCDGAASNDERFAVGYLDNDDRIWFVHGPMTKRTAATTVDDVAVTELATTTAPNWCAIASAEDYIALFWREGSRRFVQMCSSKECGVMGRLPLKPEHELLAAGCLRSGCLLAFRDERGKRHIGWMTPTGKPQWTKPLETNSDAVEIVGAGNKAVALSYVSPQGATVARVMAKGQIERAWADPSLEATPAIAWSRDRLLVSWRAGSTVETTVVPMPR